MANTFITYQQFQDVPSFNEITQILIDANIPYQSEDSNQFFDPSYANNEALRDIRLLLRPQDFEKATQVCKAYYRLHVDDVDESYFLFSFNNTELKDVLFQEKEWGIFNSVLAEKILKEKGEFISEQEIQSAELEHVFENAAPEKVSNRVLVIGYLFILIFGFTGIIFGIYILNAKKIMPQGNKIVKYDNVARMHAWIIIICSVLVFIIVTIHIATIPAYYPF